MFFLFQKFFSLFFIIFIAASTPVQASQLVSQPLVVVNGSPITQRDIAERVDFLRLIASDTERPSHEEILKSLIIEEALLQMQIIGGLDLDAPEINAQLIATAQAMNVPPEIVQNPRTFKQFKSFMMGGQLIFNTMQISVSEEEIAEQAEKLPSQLKELALKKFTPVRYHLDTLLIPTSSSRKIIWRKSNHSSNIQEARVQAEEALASAKKGTTFTQLAEEKKGKSHWKVETKWYTADQLPTHYAKALLTLPVGGLAGPVENSLGLHIIRIKEAVGTQLIKARHILLKVDKAVEDKEIQKRLALIRERCLKNKEDFEAQARRYLEDAYTVFEGGDVEWIVPEEVEPALATQLSSLQLGEISPPFKTQAGWRIVQIMKKEYLTPDHPVCKRKIAKDYLTSIKMTEAHQAAEKEYYATSHIQWLDLGLKEKIEGSLSI